MKQGMKFDNSIEEQVAASKQRLLELYRSALQQGNKCLYLGGYNYYQIKLASLPVTCSISCEGFHFEVTVTIRVQNNVISFSFNVYGGSLMSHPVLVNAAGQQLKLKFVGAKRAYICERSINKLKNMGYIVNDGFVLRIQ